MKLIVGLGNPGHAYEKTRHNVGFEVVDQLARRHGLSSPKSKFHAGVLEGSVAGERALLMQPMTYVNRSGQAVGEAARFYKLPPRDLLIVVDDVALPCGTIRLRAGGSAGGHNGLADIERALNTRNYPRLRMGIDPPQRVPQRDYVLGRFTQAQRERLEPALGRAVEAIESWIEAGIDQAMNIHNATEV